MAIGRTFPEALQKAARSLETGRDGLASLLRARSTTSRSRRRRCVARDLGDGCAARARGQGERCRALARESCAQRSRKLVAIATPDRLFYVADAMRAPVSMTDEELYALTAHRSLVPRANSPHRRAPSASSISSPRHAARRPSGSASATRRLRALRRRATRG